MNSFEPGIVSLPNIGDTQAREPYQWAAEKVHRLLHDPFLVEEANAGIIDDPEQAWKIILLLIEAAPSRKTLLAVASPLRQLLNPYFDEFISRVADEAARNDRLAYALSHVFIHDEKHLERLFRLGRRAAVMSFADDNEEKQSEEVDRLVTEWFRWKREQELTPGVDWVIEQLFWDLPDCDPNTCWQVINRLLQESQCEEELRQVADVISELLESNHAEFVEIIRQSVSTNKRLAYALGSTFMLDEHEAEWAGFINQHCTTENPFAE
jgi:hypothetical protein